MRKAINSRKGQTFEEWADLQERVQAFSEIGEPELGRYADQALRKLVLSDEFVIGVIEQLGKLEPPPRGKFRR